MQVEESREDREWQRIRHERDMRNTLGPEKPNRLGQRLFGSIEPIRWVVSGRKLIAEISLNVASAYCQQRLYHSVLINGAKS